MIAANGVCQNGSRLSEVNLREIMELRFTQVMRRVFDPSGIRSRLRLPSALELV